MDRIDRTCPKCRTIGSHYFSQNVPAAYGANSPFAVLVRCGSTPGCEYQWRAVLRENERPTLGRLRATRPLSTTTG